MIVQTSQLFNCVNRSDPQTAWIDGCIGDRYKCVKSFYFQKGTFVTLNQGITLTLAIIGNTITDATAYTAGQTPEDFTQEFDIGETIALPGGGSTYMLGVVINGMTAPINGMGSTITFTGSLPVGNIASPIYVSGLITGLDYLYNLLPNASTPQFNSLTDGGTQQKYIVSGLNAAVSTPIFFTIGTSSYGWVTDTLTGNVSQASIAGAGITADYKQQFTVTHYFTITPLALNNWLRNFQQGNAPNIYPLAYATGINAYYVAGTPNIAASYTGINTGTTCWANQNNAGTVPEFSLVSVAYIDNASGDALSAIDFTKTNLVTITIKSASGLFVNGSGSLGTKIILTHIYIPLSNSDYTNTSTTLRQNFMNDKALQTLGAAAVNGEFYGSAYSIFQNVVCTYVDANTATITCSAIYAAQLQTFLTGKQSSNRNYALLATVETATGNRVAVLCDCQNMRYDQRNPALFSLGDYFHFHPYPQLTTDTPNCAGMEGDPFFIRIPFRVLTTPVNRVTPILNRVTVSIVAIKSGESDFTVESTSFNTSNACLYGGVQQVNITGTKGYISYANDPYNSANLYNKPSYTSGAMTGYELQYGFILRYDYWNPITSTSPGGTNCGNDINNDIANVDNAWANLSQNGWSLVLRFQADIIGYDGYITSFVCQKSIEVIALGSPADSYLQYTEETIYYDDSVVMGTVIPEIKKGGITRIRSIFTYNGFPTTGHGAYYGSIFIDIPNAGGVFTRRFASSEIPSETGSPFTATTNLNPVGIDTMDQYAHGGLRIGWYKRSNLYGTVITETNYNDAGINWNANIAPVPVVRLGFKPVSVVIADETGTIIESEDGFQISPD